MKLFFLTAILIFGLDLLQVIAIVLGIIEVVARIVPSVGMWAPLGIIVKVLNWLSELLNRKK